MSQNTKECSLHGDTKGKKRWLKKTKYQDPLTKKITVIKMMKSSRSKGKKIPEKPPTCSIRYKCERHGHEVTSEELEDYLNTVELSEVNQTIHTFNKMFYFFSNLLLFLLFYLLVVF